MSTTHPLPLDAAARDELARKAEAARAKAEETHAPRWYKPFELRSDTDYAEDAEFLAACTPDVILALLAAVERGEADTARLDWLSADCAQNAQLIDIVDGEWRATTYNGAGQVETVRESMRDAIDEAMAGQDRATARAHPPIQETDDAESR